MAAVIFIHGLLQFFIGLLRCHGETEQFLAGIFVCLRYYRRQILIVPELYRGRIRCSFQNLLASVQGEQVDAQYTDRIAMRAIVPQEHAATFESRMIEAFNAAVTPELVGTTNRPVKL